MSDNVKYSLTNSRKCKPDFTKLESGYYWVVKKGTIAWQVAFYDSFSEDFCFVGDPEFYKWDMISQVIKKPITGDRRKVIIDYSFPPE